MQQVPPPSERNTLHVFMSDTIVAGYFEQGAWRPVTFEEYVRLVWDTENFKPPAYLKPAEGFLGIMVMLAKGGIPMQDVAIPHFVPGTVPERRL